MSINTLLLGQRTSCEWSCTVVCWQYCGPSDGMTASTRSILTVRIPDGLCSLLIIATTATRCVWLLQLYLCLTVPTTATHFWLYATVLHDSGVARNFVYGEYKLGPWKAEWLDCTDLPGCNFSSFLAGMQTATILSPCWGCSRFTC